MSKVELSTIIDRVLDAQAEMVRRSGVSPGDALVMAGLALGVLLAGDR